MLCINRPSYKVSHNPCMINSSKSEELTWLEFRNTCYVRETKVYNIDGCVDALSGTYMAVVSETAAVLAVVFVVSGWLW